MTKLFLTICEIIKTDLIQKRKMTAVNLLRSAAVILFVSSIKINTLIFTDLSASDLAQIFLFKHHQQ